MFPRILLSLGFLLSISAARAADPPTSQSGRVVTFAPGVRIDWRSRRVEVDAEVVLRQGDLELLACSRNSKEHESILRVRARPLHIYQALGLIGLPDGQPPAWDVATSRPVEALGTPLKVLLRVGKGENARTEDARDWLAPKHADAPMKDVAWYFVGRAPRGQAPFGADTYGTVAATVPFNNSILLLARKGAVAVVGNRPPTTQAAPPRDDAQYPNQPEDLALVARTEVIPPLGTAVVLLISREQSVAVRVDRFGRLIHAGRQTTVESLADALRGAPDPLVTIEVEPFTPEADVEELVAALRAAGVSDHCLRRESLDATAFAPHDAAAAAELLLHQLDLHRSMWRDLTAELSRVATQVSEQRRDLAESWTKLRAAWDRSRVAPTTQSASPR